MHDTDKLRFILHISDFHLSGKENITDQAEALLKQLAKALKTAGYKIEYLIHTGDIINSGDLFDDIASKCKIPDMFWESTDKTTSDGKVVKRFMHEEYAKAAYANTIEQKTLKGHLDWATPKPTTVHLKVFDKMVRKEVEKRFKLAEKILSTFITDLNVSFGNVVLCSGNHDVLRPLAVQNNSIKCAKVSNDDFQYECPNVADAIMQPFSSFVNNLKVANCTARYGDSDSFCAQLGLVTFCGLDDLNILILNTNWINPKDQKPGYYCVRCDKVKDAIKANFNENTENKRLNLILAHKPIYEICEKARLSYKRYTKTSFMTALQNFAGEDGIYLCGDKHTRSIVSSYFHNIPHYIGGEPIKVEQGKKSEVEYNLIAVSDGKVSMERKIHLSSSDGKKWECDIRPQDGTVKKLYDLSKMYIIKNSFGALGASTSYSSWEGLCHDLYNWSDETRSKWYRLVDQVYHSICRYRIEGKPINNDLPKEEIFKFVEERIVTQMKSPAKNVLNIRGGHSSSKSMFLGLFYVHLMMEYSKGKIDFIPAYFNLESKEIYRKMESGVLYYRAVTEVFDSFTKEVQKIAEKEHQAVCYFIDGLDELDCWSLSTEDSVGRGILNILAEFDNAWYIMAFSQHNLPRFKNTMPTRKYNDTSDIMYFNPIDITEHGSSNARFVSFVEAFLQLRAFKKSDSSYTIQVKDLPGEKRIGDNSPKGEDYCDVIRNFRRLTITPGFLYQNFDYITKKDENGNLKHKTSCVSEVYYYFVDKQDELCLKQLGYGYVNYAPAMAYYYSYKGFTYEKFKYLQRDNALSERHELKLICQNDTKIYPAFLFIKKNKDAREFLIAMHYNRELRYYAENPNEVIDDESILNEFISRNIAVMIRKLWTDSNKFVIACEQLLQRDELSNCTQSVLIYCLTHLQIYEPIRNKLQNKMLEKAVDTLRKQGLWEDDLQNVAYDGADGVTRNFWAIRGKDDAEKMERFLQLSLRHSMVLFNLMSSNEETISEKHNNSDAFWEYNRQHQMLYYGDLSNKNDANIHALKPGMDAVYGGFDFHDCYNSLYVKLSSDSSYPLREYDLMTICDLIDHRLDNAYLNEHIVIKNKCCEDTFFFRRKDRDRAASVLEQVLKLVNKHCEENNINADDNPFKKWKTRIENRLKEMKEQDKNEDTAYQIQ